MQKLQELLDKHKEKLRDRGESVYSLSDLIFSSSFLSLLEWKYTMDGYTERWINKKQEKNSKAYFEYEYEYHKINLALLESDEERVQYIEENTI